MKGTAGLIRLAFSLLILTAFVSSPAQASSVVPQLQAQTGCSTVDFLVLNATGEEVFIDVTNWTDRTRWLSIMQPKSSATFSLGTGMYEFWANNYQSGSLGWDLSDGAYYPTCATVKVIMKRVRGEPAFVIRSFEN